MDSLNDRLEAWVRTHPWSWAWVGALVMGAFVLSLETLVDRESIDGALPSCAVWMGVWFVMLGVTAKRRARRS